MSHLISFDTFFNTCGISTYTLRSFFLYFVNIQWVPVVLVLVNKEMIFGTKYMLVFKEARGC